MAREFLCERLNWSQAGLQSSFSEPDETGKRNLYLRGICIQGEVKNHNERVYPLAEVSRAVQQINEAIARGETVYGEADHPDGLKINLDRVSHIVESLSLEGTNGIGKLRIVPTPMGSICRTLVECGGKLGVSTRGVGNVDPSTGRVSDFEIVTIDIVARPSAPDAYPNAMFERRYYGVGDILDSRRGREIERLSHAVCHDAKAQKYLTEEIRRWLRDTLECEGG